MYLDRKDAPSLVVMLQEKFPGSIICEVDNSLSLRPLVSSFTDIRDPDCICGTA